MNRKWCRLLRAGAENNPVLLAAGLPQKIRAVSLGKRTVTVDGVRRLWTQVIPTGIEKKKARTLRQRAESACVSGKKFLLVLYYPQGRACERGATNKEIHFATELKWWLLELRLRQPTTQNEWWVKQEGQVPSKQVPLLLLVNARSPLIDSCWIR